MSNYNKYIENAEFYLNRTYPDRKKAIYFYMKAMKETKSIEKKAIISNNINQLKNEVNIEIILKQIEDEK